MIAETDEVNGFLVGGASLRADSFVAIARSFS
jgi:triosephosphate isomerase